MYETYIEWRQRYLPNYQETLVHYHKSFGVLQARGMGPWSPSLAVNSGPKLVM